MNVSTAKIFEKNFRESFIIELYWEDKIDFVIDQKLENLNAKKFSFLKIIKKYLSKKLRRFLTKKS